ncbi:MAG: 50S ribosomal protein L21 [Deltaproteobacteria bacterium]|nr:50S ribosomal protein L21 [Deltaproteobacteria bacterium]MBI3389607.1 50S ribosomal protein L21 [Deltaproteobacteria bacterium]
MDYAVIRTGGKQYRVAPGDVIRIEKLNGEAGHPVAFTEVLMASANGAVKVGAPLLSGVRVAAEIVRQGRAKKILVFKKKRRKNYRRHQGHRQYETTVRVTGIEAE